MFTKCGYWVRHVGFVEIRCLRVFFNPCPSFPIVPVGTDLLECKQPWITVGSLLQLHKATKPWEHPFIQLVIITFYHTDCSRSDSHCGILIKNMSLFLFSFTGIGISVGFDLNLECPIPQLLLTLPLTCRLLARGGVQLGLYQ